MCAGGVSEMNKLTRVSPQIVLAVIFTGLLTGCTIEEGIGPQGPPGNANVFSFGLQFRLDDAVINETVASVQYTVPELTPYVVDEGAVLLFFRDQGTWTAMPYTYGVESLDLPAVDYTVSLGFGYDDNFLEIFYEVSTPAVDMGTLADRDIKVVIIDGFPLSKTGIDLSDWEIVKATFGLTD
jgi:hypothetical protein